MGIENTYDPVTSEFEKVLQYSYSTRVGILLKEACPILDAGSLARARFLIISGSLIDSTPEGDFGCLMKWSVELLVRETLSNPWFKMSLIGRCDTVETLHAMYATVHAVRSICQS
jgi:hypothetical protein